MNNSPKFWAIVAGVLPDFIERQKRLKELHRRLNAENWE
jgi:predicted metal-dependent hydrolase